MVRTFADTTFKWVDILYPSPEELHDIGLKYGIHEAFIADVLQPEHLPKYEPVAETSFFILRYYSAKERSDVNTIQGLTNKIAIFHTNDLVITIHRLEIAFINDLKANLTDAGRCKGTLHLLNRIVKSVFQSYEAPAHRLSNDIDYYESQTFLKLNPPPILKGLYHVKRQVEVCRKLLILSKDILDKVDAPELQDPNKRDTRDLFVKVMTLFDSLSENTNHLFYIYLSISSQRTNEVIRVLTIFSVFFMPLTFIVGIYGMNFDFMPELKWRFGYPAVGLLMVTVTMLIYLWFRKKHWL